MDKVTRTEYGVRGSGNVFQDLGLPNPEIHRLKARLVSHLSSLIDHAGPGLPGAAEQLGLSPEQLTRLTCGHFRDVGLDTLAHYLTVLGGSVTLTICLPEGLQDQIAL